MIGGNTYELQSIESLTGTSGNDLVTDDASANLVYGGSGNDTFNGSTGDDTFYGGAGNDHLFDDGGTNSLYGGSNADTIEININASGGILDGGSDTDTLFTNSGFAWNVDLGAGTAVSGGGQLYRRRDRNRHRQQR